MNNPPAVSRAMPQEGFQLSYIHHVIGETNGNSNQEGSGQARSQETRSEEAGCSQEARGRQEGSCTEEGRSSQEARSSQEGSCTEEGRSR